MNKIFREIAKTSEFSRDFKRLRKKFTTLEEDLENFVKVQLNLYYKKNIDNGGILRIPDSNIEYPEIYKAKKFACKSLKGRGVNSGIRIIYAYYREEDKIEFLEIYFKGEKENEDRERIKKHYARSTVRPPT